MKRFIFVLFVFLSVFNLSAATDDKALNINVTVPEDWGVNMPDDAVNLDHLVLELNLETESASLIENGDLYLGSLENLSKETTINFLYYGNLSSDYNVRIKKESVKKFSSENSPYEMDFTTSFESADLYDDNVEVSILNSDEVILRIMPSGPVNGKQVLKMILDIEDAPFLYPGEYSATILLEMENLK